MKQLKTVVSYLFQAKLVVLGLALFNFFYVYSKTPPLIQTGGKISFYNREWYETSDFIDVPILLTAAFLLLVNRKWSYFAAGALSGIIVIEGLIQSFRTSLLEVWKFVLKNDLDILLQWEIQFFLALVIFGFAVFYLTREVSRKSILR